jgi:hypothetical protein
MRSAHQAIARAASGERAEAQRSIDVLDREVRLAGPQPDAGADVPAAREARVERQRPIGVANPVDPHRPGNVLDLLLWADRFDGSLEDVFELQDNVAVSVAGIIEPALQAAETARSVGRPTTDLTAYDLYLRAYAMALSSARQIPEALRLMEQAIARDPRYGTALAWAAFCCYRLVGDGRSEDPEVDRLKGADFARRALVAGDDPGILANAAQALAYFGEDIGAMMALIGCVPFAASISWAVMRTRSPPLRTEPSST